MVESEHMDFDLLLSDVIMPKMNGPQLFKRLAVSRPELKVLFMSGYTGDIMQHHGILDTDSRLLLKPFTLPALSSRIREALASPTTVRATPADEHDELIILCPLSLCPCGEPLLHRVACARVSAGPRLLRSAQVVAACPFSPLFKTVALCLGPERRHQCGTRRRIHLMSCKREEAFVEGASLARDMRWGDALERFEASARLRPHAGTSYKHRYLPAGPAPVRARSCVVSSSPCPERNRGEDGAGQQHGHGHRGVSAGNRPGSCHPGRHHRAGICAGDGRWTALGAGWNRRRQDDGAGGDAPTRPSRAGACRAFLAGARSGNPCGRHLAQGFCRHRTTRERFTQAVTVRFRSCSSACLARCASNPTSLERVVTVDDLDVGMAPLTLSRAPGRYHVLVRKKGFVTYETHADVDAGERVDLRAVPRPGKGGVDPALVVLDRGRRRGAGNPPPVRTTPPDPTPKDQRLTAGGLGWAVRVP